MRGRIALLVLVALAPPTIVAIVGELAERSEARRHAEQDVLDTTRLVGADVERVLHTTDAFLVALSRDLAEQPGRRDCARLIGLIPRATSRYSSVGVTRPDGTVYCGATQMGLARPARGVDVSDTPWFGETRAKMDFVLADVGRDPLTGMTALVAARPVPGAPGEPPRILFAAIGVDGLAQSTALKDPPRGTTFVLFDHRGTILIRVPDLPGSVGRRLPDLPLVKTVLERHEGTAEVEGLDGVKRIQGFAPVGGLAGERVFIASGRSAATVFADPSEDLQRFVTLGLTGLGLAMLLSYLATKLLLERWTSGVVASARRFGAGDLTARAPVPRGFAELTDVATALNSAAEDIERRQAEQAKLMAELVAAEEETRRRIAADIHDDTAQAVAAAGLRMDALIAELKDRDAREAAIEARKALGEANRRLRRLLFELRPPALDEAGLGAAIELFLADSFGDDGVAWRVEDRLEAEPLPETRAVLYRAALEALTNVRKHAHARSVDVLLERRGMGVAVRVEDDGEGFELPEPDAPSRPGHIGLVSMRERAEAAGGRFALASVRGQGTTVDFWMPEPNGGRPGA